MNADEFEEFLTGKLDELEKDPRWITPEVINTVRKRLKERRKKGGLPSGRIE